MANIQVSELKPIGTDLFSDSESFMADLTDQEFSHVTGGLVASDQPLPSSWLTPVVSVDRLLTSAVVSSVIVSKQISQVVQSIQLGG